MEGEDGKEGGGVYCKESNTIETVWYDTLKIGSQLH